MLDDGCRPQTIDAMKLNSQIFDSIRVKSKKKRVEKDVKIGCQWEGCDRPGTHRAPKGRDHEGEYLHFCVDHVREYNKSYNYFSGMNDDAVRSYQKDSMVGHRPTWKMGVNSKGAAAGEAASGASAAKESPQQPSGARRPKLKALEARAFDTLGLEPTKRGADVKSRYKELVKRHHPDANGGDRSSEERLRQIIQAYNLLKKAGFC